MFKIAYGAGHNNATANGIPAALDPGRTNEWFLNDRVARYFAQAAKQYPVELLRVDDPAGLAPVRLATRCKAANDWGADFFLSIHHNAGINGGTGGGLVGFCRKAGTEAAKYRDAIYESCLASGGIRGDRWDATQEKGFYVLTNTNMPAVLMEYGFMDSVTDVPIILTEEYAKAMAYATMEGIAKAAGLKKLESVPVAALPVLSQGASGRTVEALQQLLLAQGYSLPEFGPDGIWGEETETVVRAWQKAAGIFADGVMGPEAWAALLGL